MSQRPLPDLHTAVKHHLFGLHALQNLQSYWAVCPHLHQHLHSASQARHVTLREVTGKGQGLQVLILEAVLGGRGGGAEPSTSSLAAAALSQLLAIGTGVNHLMCVLAHPDCRPIGVSLLGLKRAMHLGTVAAALTRGRHEGGEKEIKDKQKR